MPILKFSNGTPQAGLLATIRRLLQPSQWPCSRSSITVAGTAFFV